MNCAFCGKNNPKDWTKYCSRPCATKGSSLEWLIEQKLKAMEKTKKKLNQARSPL